MTFIEKVGVLLRDPKKLLHFCQYSSARFIFGNGIAKIPQGGRIRTSSFSEYLSVYGLMPNEGELVMIRKFLAQATEVFDLGANVGVWTVLMNKANPQARVHSFEPNPNTYALLERNIKQNNCSNVLLNLAAVSNTAGQLNFQVPKNASIFGRVAPMVEGSDKEGRFSNADSFMVPSVRLNEYCNAHLINEIDFLKIDVEGHELAALSGMEPLLSQHRVKAIYIETIKENHDRMGTRFSELLGFINDCGYQFYTLSKDGDPESPVGIDQIKAHNHLCLPCRVR
jgi:FkbM family methyltransferase